MTRVDPCSSGTVCIIDTDAEINEGTTFFYSDIIQLAASGSMTFTLLIGSKNAHFLFSVGSGQFGFSYVTYENAIANNDGTLLTPRNNNREMPDNSTATLRLNPTGLNIGGATQLRRGYDGTSLKADKASGGSASLNRKVILKKNTKYSLTITNLSTADVNDIQVNMGWDELL